MLDPLQSAADERREQKLGVSMVLSCGGDGVGVGIASRCAGQDKTVAGRSFEYGSGVGVDSLFTVGRD